MAHGKSRLLRRFVLSYLVIITLPLLVVFAVSFPAIERVIINDANERNYELLQGVQEQIDRQLADLINTVESIGRNPDVRRQLNGQSEFSYFLLQRELEKTVSSSGFIAQLLLYSYRDDRIVGPSMSFPAQQLGRRYFLTERWDRGSFLLRMRSVTSPFYVPATPIRTNAISVPERLVTFVFPYPFRSTTAAPASIAVLVRESALVDAMSPVLDVASGSAAVLDPRANVVARSPGFTDLGINGSASTGNPAATSVRPSPGTARRTAETALLTIGSEVMDWTYVAAIPPAPLLTRVRTTRIIGMAAFGAFLLLQFFLIYLASSYNYKPIKRLAAHVEQLGESSDRSRGVQQNDELFAIQDAFDRLILEQRPPGTGDDERAPARESLLYALLRGEFLTVDEFNDRAARTGVKLLIGGDMFVVASLADSEGKPLDAQSIESAFERNSLHESDVIRSALVVHDLRPDSVIAVVSCGHGEADVLLDCFVRVADRLLEEQGQRVFVGIGSFVGKTQSLPSSYSTSQFALDSVRSNEANPVQAYDRLQPTLEGYSEYPYELLHQLRFSGTRNKDGSIDATLSAIAEYLGKGALPVHSARAVFTETLRTVVAIVGRRDPRLARRILAEATPLMLSGRAGIEEMRRHVAAVQADIVELSADNPRLGDLEGAVLDFINAHYREPQFGIEYVADHFEKSVSGLSHFFRSHTGHTFQNYVLNLKIEDAKQLLKESTHSIDEIARQLHFSNASSFIKSFRKRTGVSPGRYRSQHETRNNSDMLSS